MNNQSLDYREFLLRELEKRKTKNPKYSLRAFARYLGLLPSRLSEIIHGKVGLSPEKALLIVDKLNLQNTERELFLDLVESQHARSNIARKMATQRILEKIKGVAHIDLEILKTISDWYHFALLEYLLLPKASSDEEVMSRVFNIQVDQVRAALQRLEKLEMLEKRDGRWFPQKNGQNISLHLQSAVLQESYKDLLSKANKALDYQPEEHRDFKACISRFSKADIPFVKRRMREFQEELSAQLKLSPDKDSVYAMLFHFYDLMEPQNGPDKGLGSEA